MDAISLLRACCEDYGREAVAGHSQAVRKEIIHFCWTAGSMYYVDSLDL